MHFSPHAVAVAVILAGTAILGWNSVQHRGDALAGAQAQLTALARSSEAQASSAFAGIETMLRDVREAAPPPDAPLAEKQRFDRWLESRTSLNEDLLTLAVVEGRRVVQSSQASLLGRDVSDRPYIAHFASNPGETGMYVSEPTRSALGRMVIFVALSVPGRDALVVGAVEPRLIGNALQAARPSFDGSSIGILNRNGRFLMRLPDPEDSYPGRALSSDSPLAHLIGQGRIEGVVRAVAPLDGVDRMIAFRASSRYPLVVATTAPVNAILRPWTRQLAVNGVILAALSVTSLLLAAFLDRRHRERARDAAAIAAERDFTGTVIDALPGVFYVISEDGRFIRWNENFLRLTGLSAAQFAATSPLDLFGEDEREMVAGRIRRVFETGEAWAEARLKVKGGKRLPYYFTGRRCLLDGRPHLVGMGLDVSELKTLQVELERSNAELNRFAYVASHQLQEPLRTVASYVQLLGRRYGGQLDQEADEFIGFAVAGVKRMSALINDLLEFSRVSNRPPQTRPVDTGRLVAAVIHDLGHALAETGGRVSVVDLPMVEGDPALLPQIFQNLIGNALKYRRPGEPPVVTIGARPVAEMWEFTVADNGIGIAPEHHEAIFDLFHRLHGPDAFAGTGIGLPVARKIVERHGGRMWVESAEGEGARFLFTLPACSETVPA